MIEWKYTNGSWRVAYMSVLVGMSVGSVAPIARVPARLRFGRRVRDVLLYAFHVLPAAVSWSAIVFTDFGYTQPWPSACPYAPVPVDTKSV